MDPSDVIANIRATVDTVIHAGAGLCKELTAYEQLGAKSIILIEPHPQLFAELSSRTQHNSKVTATHAALCTSAGETQFHLNQVSRFSGLYEPRSLLEVFPNAGIADTVRVKAISLEELCDNKGSNGLLVLDVNGAEHELLESIDSSILDGFAWIIVRASRPGLFAAPNPSQDLGERLISLGFTAFSFSQADAPFGICVAKRDEAVLLKQELAKVEQTLQGARYAREEEAAEIQRLQNALQDTEQVRQELEAARQQADGLQQAYAQLEGSQQAQLEQIEQLRRQLTAAEEQHAQVVERLEQAASEAQAQRVTEIERLKQALSEAEERLDTERGEMLERQDLLDREMLKAEAQLELIKDVLLREKAF